MVRSKRKQVKIVAPVGDVPSTDRNLCARIKKLPRDASVSDVFREIGKWESVAVRRFREKERTTKSGKLDIHCW